VPTLLRM